MIQWMTDHWQDVTTTIGAIVVIASTITALTPTPADDRVWAKIYRIIETLGLVVGKAKDP